MVVELAPEGPTWIEMFDETWRMMRDFNGTPNMGGSLARSRRDRYSTLLPRLGTRGELNDRSASDRRARNVTHLTYFGGDSGDRGCAMG